MKSHATLPACHCSRVECGRFPIETGPDPAKGARRETLSQLFVLFDAVIPVVFRCQDTCGVGGE
jgi:hypothetical protein